MEREHAMMFVGATYPRDEWQNWYRNSAIMVVHRAKVAASERGITSATIRTAIAARCNTHQRMGLQQSIKRCFQAEAMSQILQSQQYESEHHIRTKLRRWRVASVPEGILARRALTRLQQAFALVPIRVAIVLFRTWLNGWCTARRFQQRRARCLLGCHCELDDICQDSIEHYAHCPVLLEFASNTLHMPPSCLDNMLGFLCLNKEVAEDTRILQFLVLYAVYSATNAIRAQPRGIHISCMREFLLQYVHQGASGSSKCQSVVRQALAPQHVARRRRLM